jgi:hypothetical protein
MRKLRIAFQSLVSSSIQSDLASLFFPLFNLFYSISGQQNAKPFLCVFGFCHVTEPLSNAQ